MDRKANEEVAQLLGLEADKFAKNGGARLVTIEPSQIENIRFSTPETQGSNIWWAPGMKTSGGQFEAVIARVENVLESNGVSISEVNDFGAGESLSAENSYGKPSSKVLRNNMIASGQEVPNYKNAAHHIVAGTSAKASESRAILKKYDIGINDSENGAFLSTDKNITDTTYHPSVHTNDYYRKVNGLLRNATSREDVLDILDYIRAELLDGSF